MERINRRKPMDSIIAITRDNQPVCRDCISDSNEFAVFSDADDAHELMEKFKIGVIRASDLKFGTKVCDRCGSVIKDELK
jgi:hypothetical protein